MFAALPVRITGWRPDRSRKFIPSYAHCSRSSVTDENLREKYFDIMMKRIENYAGTSIRPYIDFKKSYSVSDFKNDYHSYKGNAYGLANTLFQTAMLKPKIRNKKIKNLFYAGQLTVPGPGVPPSLISGKIAATQLIKHLNTQEA